MIEDDQMTLLDWKTRPHGILHDVRIILRTEGRSDASVEECREWARQFIRKYEPRWNPGEPLDPEVARLVGGAFERMVARARRFQRRHFS